MQEAKQAINNSKNIYLIPSKEPEAAAATLALFYTLKELGKNVNLLLDGLPEGLKFLAPSLDFLSFPKNFVISVPNKIAKISQISYEKNDESLKIHLSLENGRLKKDDISFYYAEAKPDLIITLGVKDYSKELAEHLDSYGFLLESPILNIDSSMGAMQGNKNFGTMNIIEERPLLEITMGLINNLHKQ